MSPTRRSGIARPGSTSNGGSHDLLIQYRSRAERLNCLVDSDRTPSQIPRVAISLELHSASEVVWRIAPTPLRRPQCRPHAPSLTAVPFSPAQLRIPCLPRHHSVHSRRLSRLLPSQ